MKLKLLTLAICVLAFNAGAQSIVNGDLEGLPAGISMVPAGWQNVPYSDVNCTATMTGWDSPDITDSTGPAPIAGIVGYPYSGIAFESGLVGTYFQEGIMQTVTGFTIGETYELDFYQAVVKQDNALDGSGSWAVYIDTTLAGISTPMYSSTVYNDPHFAWEQRTISFTAAASNHVIKFLPVDDDTNSNFSITDTSGALRMGIDKISIDLSKPTAVSTLVNENNALFFPNPCFDKSTLLLNGMKQEIVLDVYNALGDHVKSLHASHVDRIEINMREFGSGMYFYKILVDKKYATTGKLVVE